MCSSDLKTCYKDKNRNFDNGLPNTQLKTKGHNDQINFICLNRTTRLKVIVKSIFDGFYAFFVINTRNI